MTITEPVSTNLKTWYIDCCREVCVAMPTKLKINFPCTWSTLIGKDISTLSFYSRFTHRKEKSQMCRNTWPYGRQSGRILIIGLEEFIDAWVHQSCRDDRILAGVSEPTVYGQVTGVIMNWCVLRDSLYSLLAPTERKEINTYQICVANGRFASLRDITIKSRIIMDYKDAVA